MGGREGSERIYSVVEKRDRGTQSTGKETERSGELKAKSREWGLGLERPGPKSRIPPPRDPALPPTTPGSFLSLILSQPIGLGVWPCVCLVQCLMEHCSPMSRSQIFLHLHPTWAHTPRVCHPLLAPAVREKKHAGTMCQVINM